MKTLQQNLLIILALSLCGLCVYQWYGQTLQRNQIQRLNQMVYEQAAAIQGYTNSMKTMDRQIAQMDARISELKAAATTNEQQVIAQRRQIVNLQAASEGLTNQIAQYKKGGETLEGRLKEAYDGIKKQNESLQELAAQRDEFVKKYNDSVKERNEIVAKYNELATQVEKLQGGAKP